MCTLSCTDTRNLSLLIFCRDQVEPRLESFHEEIFQPKVRYFYPSLLIRHCTSIALSASELNRGSRARVSVCTITVPRQIRETEHSAEQSGGRYRACHSLCFCTPDASYVFSQFCCAFLGYPEIALLSLVNCILV